MSNFNFGAKSEKELSSCNSDLQMIMKEAIKISPIDFGIVYGRRPAELQFELFKKGRELQSGVWIIVNKKFVVTNLDGYQKKSMHNYEPSKAVDIRIYVPGHPELAYDPEHLCYVAGIIMTVADQLFKERWISHRIRWGGNWDQDGIILFDQSLADRPHFEIIE